jgi:hypothetical protein
VDEGTPSFRYSSVHGGLHASHHFYLDPSCLDSVLTHEQIVGAYLRMACHVMLDQLHSEGLVDLAYSLKDARDYQRQRDAYLLAPQAPGRLLAAKVIGSSVRPSYPIEEE